MDVSPLPAPENDPDSIADAKALFRDEPPPKATSATAPPSPVSTGAYEVEDRPEPPPHSVTSKNAPIEPETRSGRRSIPRSTNLDRSEAVEQVWSRGAEWGWNLLPLAAAGLAFGFLITTLLSWERYAFAFLVLIAAGLTLVVLSYPILITLERPVRITPEQAIGDFYGALSHHAPHYRRMWLLLSAAGRVSGSYASFEGFKAYWQSRLRALKKGRASSFTPLKFQVQNFKSEKSAGKSDLEVSYVVVISVRGRQADGPVETVDMRATLVKGPDRMWYLDEGTLP